MKNINLKSDNLAINGGDPVRVKPWIDNITTGDEEINSVKRVLNKGYLSLFEGSHTPDYPFSFKGGPEVQKLEEEWCEFYDVKYSVSMNSASSGLFAAMGALNIGFGDEVIVSPYTMTACALAPLIYGAIPVFADVDIETGCIDPVSIVNSITDKTKAILLVHQFGFPAEMDEIKLICKNNNIKLIEDCAQAHGAKYKGKNVGTFGDIGVFSLNVNKTIQAGEGGVCITNDPELAYRLQLIRNHGEAVVEKAEYENITNIAGFNYRMTEICAAISREQLKKLNSLNEKRLDLVYQLRESLSKFDFLTPLGSKALEHNDIKTQPTYYVFPMRFNQDRINISRDFFVKALKAEGIYFYPGYVKPLYLQPLYQRKQLFKHGYPFNAIENKDCKQIFEKGTSKIAEKLHFKEMLISEHIRPPHNSMDIQDIVDAIDKLVN